jgi:hypothetical protein
MRSRLPALLLLPPLAACPVKPARIQQLLDVDWYGEACVAATVLGDHEMEVRVIEAHAKQAPQFRARIMPLETFIAPGAAPAPGAPGYGHQWAVFEGTWDARFTPAPEHDGWVEIVEPGRDGPLAWSVCPPDVCTPTWVAGQLGVRTRPESGVWAAVSQIARVVAIPFTLMIDLATTKAAPNHADAGPPLSFRVVEALTKGPIEAAPEGFPAVWSAPQCTGAGSCVRRWVGTAQAAPPGSAGPGVQVRFAWRHEECDVAAAWSLPLPEGDQLGTRLERLSTVDLAQTPPTAGQLHAP